MINITKMEFYIAYKNKTWWILGMVAACFVLFFTIMVHYSSDGMINSPEDVAISNVENGVVEHNMKFVDYCEQIVCSDILLMFVTIFSILLGLQEYRNGYIKNIWMNIEKKPQLFLSKILVVMSYVLFIFLVMFGVIALCDVFLLKTKELGELSKLIKICIVQYYFEVVFATIFMSLAIWLKKVVPSLICGIVYISVANVLVCGMINLMVNKLLDLDKPFEIENYLVYGSIMQITLNSENERIFRAICVATIWGGMALIFSTWQLKKGDVL